MWKSPTFSCSLSLHALNPSSLVHQYQTVCNKLSGLSRPRAPELQSFSSWEGSSSSALVGLFPLPFFHWGTYYALGALKHWEGILVSPCPASSFVVVVVVCPFTFFSPNHFHYCFNLLIGKWIKTPSENFGIFWPLLRFLGQKTEKLLKISKSN